MLHRFAIRQPLQALQHHDCGHHRWRHAAAAPVAEQVSEELIGEQGVTLAVQQRVHRAPRHDVVAEPDHVIEEVTLTFRQPEGHQPLPVENYSHVILDQRCAQSADLRPRKTPAT